MQVRGYEGYAPKKRGENNASNSRRVRGSHRNIMEKNSR